MGIEQFVVSSDSPTDLDILVWESNSGSSDTRRCQLWAFSSSGSLEDLSGLKTGSISSEFISVVVFRKTR